MSATAQAPIPMSRWGRDHWSTYAYVANRILNHGGVPNKPNMRCDPELHPAHADYSSFTGSGGTYPTRLKDGELTGHDDWSCVEDFKDLGLVRDDGSGLHPLWRFTDAGWNLWHEFDRHIADHPIGWSKTFVPSALKGEATS